MTRPDAPEPPTVTRLEPASLRARFEAGERLAVLDVREPFERAIATIPIPPHCIELAIPMGEVASRLDDLAATARERPLVVYCHHGQRSMVVGRWLAARGLSGLANLEGGVDAWSTRVDPSTPRY